MKISYERTMEHSYLMIEAGEYKESFEEEMLKNKIPGVLPFHKVNQDNQITLSYEITQKMSLMEYCKLRMLDVDLICGLITAIIHQIKYARTFLLEADSFVVQHELIYVGANETDIWLCYYPGYHCPIKEQLTNLIETWMKVIDYADQRTVKLVYELYHHCRGNTCTYDELLDVVDRMRREVTLEAPSSQYQEWSKDNDPGSNTSKIIATKEELEDERETLCYPLRSYLTLGLILITSAAVGVLLFKMGVFQDKYQQTDITKLIGGILCLVIIDSYLFYTLFQKRQKISRMVRSTELISIHEKEEILQQNECASYDNYRKVQGEQQENQEGGVCQKEKKQSLEPDELTQVLWEEEATQVLFVPERVTMISRANPEERLVINPWNTVIGSSKKQADCYLIYPTISRQHARIYYEEGTFYLEDLGSTNGTYLNDRRLKAHERTNLKHQDCVRFAEYTYDISISKKEERGESGDL